MSLQEKMTGKKAFWFLVLCCIIYFVTYMMRYDYAAVNVQIIKDFQIEKTVASIAVTGAFITYGAGQLISGFFGDRIQPKYLIIFGLIGTASINLCMSILPNIQTMTVFWCFNGFFQAMLWPPLVRIMAENFDKKLYTNACVFVTSVAVAAKIVEYLIASVIVSVAGWRYVFVVSAALGAIVVVAWIFGTKDIKSELSKNKPDNSQKAENSGNLKSIFFVSGLAFILIAIILQGMLRDGVEAWMPTFIDDVFNLGSSLSILTTAVLPLFGVLSISIATAVFNKIGDELKVSAIFFALAFICGCIMIPFFGNKSTIGIVIQIVMITLMNGSMHGVNHMLISLLPAHFVKTGKVSTIAGILNACTYVGSAVSTYGFAAVAENFGWDKLLIIWTLIAVIGGTICFACIKKWKAYRED